MVPHVKRALYISTLILVLLGGASALGADALQQPVGQSAKHGKRRHRAHLRHHRAHRGRHRAHHPRRHRAHRGHKPGAVIHRPRFRSEANATAVLLGDTVVEWQHDLLPAGQAEAFQLTASSSGLAGAVHVYISSGSAAGTLIAGLYSADSGHPGTLLSTGSTPAPRAGTWATLSLTPAQLVAGRRYWLAILGEGGKLRYRDRSRGPCPSVTSADRSLDALPASWSTARAYSDCPVSAYVTAVPSPAPSAGLGPGLGLGLAGAPPPTSSPLEEPPAPPAPPAPLTAPLAIAPSAISGSAVQGQVLTASSGSWTGSPDSYAYQWERCSSSGEDCSEIDAATETSYKLASGDVGSTLRVVVTAENSVGSTEAASEPTAVVTSPPPAPKNTALPAISGSAVEGQTLTSTTGSWTGSPTYTRHWEDCDSSGNDCSDITGATGTSYQLSAGDVGHTIRVAVTASNPGGSTTARSAQTAKVTAIAPTNTALPAISGSAVEGQTLTSTTGSWTGSPTYTRRWEDCDGSGSDCSDIAGATGSTYKLASTDVGHTIRLRVKASNSAGSSEASSEPTSAVTAPPHTPTNTTPPVVSGPAEAGQTLTSSTGTWTSAPTEFSYQWQQCEASGNGCANISGAEGSTYVLASRDVGHTVRAVVTATNAGGSAAAPSAVTATVTGPPPGAQIYVSQAGSGSQSGAGGCSNAHSLSWLNSGGNWGAGSGEVAPGTTVELCGTFTEPLETKGNGSSGRPITIAFMTNAKLAEPSCPGTGCLNVANSSEYITVDGGTNGIIENTDRGTHKQQGEAATVGIYAWGCKHCSFENLEVANLYVAEQGDATSNTEIRGIVVTGGEIEDIAIDHDVLHDIGWAVVVSLTGKSNHVDVEHDVLYHDSHGVAMTAGGSGDSLGPAIVAHDHFYADGVWSAAPGTNHMDALHCYSGGAGVHWSGGLFVYDNTFTMEGEYGVTADAYVEGTTGPECGDSTSNFWEFNNVMTGKGAGPLFALNNGLLSPYSGEDHIFNNTLIGNKTSEGVCLPLGGVPSSTSANVQYKNNIATTCQTLINVERAKLASGGLDYNLYANSGGTNTAFVCNGAGYYPSEFSAYKTCTGQESHSIATSTAKLSMTETAGVLGKPEAGSEAIGHGTNLTSLCGQTPEEALCKNIDGEPRPTTGAWNIGAY
jgi:hypothetical protein